jgi:hypothetical protein
MGVMHLRRIHLAAHTKALLSEPLDSRLIAVQDKAQVLKDVTNIISEQLGMEEGEVRFVSSSYLALSRTLFEYVGGMLARIEDIICCRYCLSSKN